LQRLLLRWNVSRLLLYIDIFDNIILYNWKLKKIHLRSNIDKFKPRFKKSIEDSKYQIFDALINRSKLQSD